MTDLKALMLYFVMAFACRVGAAPVEKPSVIPECNHLHITEGQSNSYYGNNGGNCCMCPKGSYLAGDCNANDPNSTVCKECQYDGKRKTYIDHEPHIDKMCEIDHLTKDSCQKSKVFVPGSRFSSSTCICPQGTVPTHHGFICEPAPEVETSSNSNLQPDDGNEHLASTLPSPTSSQTTVLVDAETTIPENSYSDRVQRLVTTTQVSDFSTTGLTPFWKSKDTSTAFGTRAYLDRPTTDIINHWAIVETVGIAAVFSCVLFFLIVWCCCPGLFRRLMNRGTETYTPDRTNKTVAFQSNEESTKCLIKGSKEKIGPPDDSEGDVKILDTVNSSEVVPLNAAVPTDTLVEATMQHGNQVSHLISQKEKDLRHKAFMEMASEIHEKDLCVVGRNLLPKEGREFEDIFDEKNWRRDEKARRIFLRAAELNPNLTLQDLLKFVEDKGYLNNIITEKIEALRTDGCVD